MKTVDHWICWAWSRSGDPIPLNTETYNSTLNRFQPSDYQNTAIWMEYSDAIRLADNHKAIDGIGFVFNNTNLTFVDIDDCINRNGRVDADIYQLLADVNSYTEFSVSGDGIHIYCHGRIPSYGWTPDDFDNAISMFDRSWAIVTHEHVKDFPTLVESNQETLVRLCREYEIDIHDGWQ